MRTPKTRKELLGYLWGRFPGLALNIFKEGPFYAAQVGRAVYATHMRRIDSLTFDEWGERIGRGYFP